VAAAVGDRDTLRLLAALTEADSLATGPAAWGPWKAGLVAQLVEATAATLEGRPPPQPAAAVVGPEQESLLAAGGVQLLADGGRLTVAAPDRPGLLAVVAGVLTLSAVTVRAATTLSDAATGMALLRFEVTPTFDVLPAWNQVRANIEAALDDRLSLPSLLEERERQYARHRRATAAAPPEVRVTIDNAASATSTVVEIRAPDRGPVLYEVTKALSENGVTITSALINTLGAEVIDVFYVQTFDGRQVVDSEQQRRLKTAVESAL
jgi:[protein-PII] uridylyltransferase